MISRLNREVTPTFTKLNYLSYQQYKGQTKCSCAEYILSLLAFVKAADVIVSLFSGSEPTTSRQFRTWDPTSPTDQQKSS